mgnify:FL=1
MSRKHVERGMITLHPQGVHHGPHPKALSRMFHQTKPGTDEYAVMIDTRDALDIGEPAMQVERADYHQSWRMPAPGAP